MNTLIEIEIAADGLPAEQKQKLFLFSRRALARHKLTSDKRMGWQSNRRLNCR